jgi:hypothetical protein
VVAQDPQLIVERLRDFVRYVEGRTPADGR